MYFLRVKVTFYDVITTADPVPYTAEFMFDGVGNNKTQHIRY